MIVATEVCTMSALKALVSTLPTPAKAPDSTDGKRQRTDGTSKKEAKVEQRALRKCLGDLRRVTSVTEDTYMLPAKSDDAESFKGCMDLYNGAKPAKAKAGEKGTPHPLGPCRWSVYLEYIEAALKRYKARPDDVKRIDKTSIKANDLFRSFENVVAKISTGSIPLGYMEQFCSFASTRTVKDGRQIVHISVPDNLLLDDHSEEVGLFGYTSKALYQFLSYPFRGDKQTGPAPASSEEREILKLPGNK